MTQTLLLLGSDGSLKGSIPKNIDELVGLLEQNREVLSDTSFAIDNHIIAEDFDRRHYYNNNEKMN